MVYSDTWSNLEDPAYDPTQGPPPAEPTMSQQAYDWYQKNVSPIGNQLADQLSKLNPISMVSSPRSIAQIPSKIYQGLEYASQNVALPALQEMSEAQSKDWSAQPFIGGVGEKGEFTGRLPALASYLAPYLLGAAPSGSISAGVKLPSGHEGGYHGAGVVFDPVPENALGRFMNQFIGSGEGAQAFGYGHYFGARKGTAANYLPDAEPVLHLEGKQWNPFNRGPDGFTSTTAEQTAHDALMDAPRHFTPNGLMPDIDHAIDSLTRDINTTKELIDQHPPSQRDLYRESMNLDNDEKALEFLKSNRDNFSMDTPGSLYHVEIKPPEESLMHWDKKIKDQEPEVLEKIKQVYRNLYGSENIELQPATLNMTAGDWYKNVKNNPIIRQKYPDMTGNGQALSEAMKEAGIPGIRFADQNSRPIMQAREKIADLTKSLEIHQKDLATITGDSPPEQVSKFAVQSIIDRNQSELKRLQAEVDKRSVASFEGKPIKSENDIPNILNTKSLYDPRTTAMTAVYDSKNIDRAITYLQDEMASNPRPGSPSYLMNKNGLEWLQKNRDKFTFKEPDITHNYVIFDPKELNIIKREPNLKGVI